MFDRLKYLYIKHMITEAHLDNAITKNWITEDEKKLIIESLE